MTGKPSTNFIDAPWLCTHASAPGADTSSAIVSAGKGPQETLDIKGEIRTWGGVGADGGAELLASQAPQEEDDDGPDKVEDEEEPQEEDDDARNEWGRFSSVVGFIYLLKLSLIKLSL